MPTPFLIASRLAREGYGSFKEIMGSPAEWVLAQWEHALFCDDYQETMHELNREAK